MAAKMFALFALLALCASAATATVMASGSMNPCMQYCMTQQPLAMNACMQNCMMQQSFTMGSFAMSPCMQYCMTQHPLAMNPCMQYCMKQQSFAMGSSAVNPCMQYCMMQQPFTMGSFASQTSMMLQQPWALPLQQYWTQMVMPFQQCHCGAISQVTQQPIMFNPMSMAIPPMFSQQPLVGVSF
ncbi:hypothetical protein HU200_012876 [Digitaria exilis]|uniref:Uncharacterized protein n=1 Tax=Digitaria exilis TaxID=1010633 RepID=A0A835FFI4_9POAL|nr:hypothetical protein HU200_012876 [Digitaria exilis]